MDVVSELVKQVLPALLCIVTAVLVFYATAFSIERRQRSLEKQEMRLRAFSTVMPLRISAYERAVLFLSRIQLEALMLRTETQSKTARALKEQLLEEIRAEYEHNAVQQLYISDAGWSRLIFARDQMAEAIRTETDAVYETLGERASALDLARQLVAAFSERTDKPVEEAISLLKKELNRLSVS